MPRDDTPSAPTTNDNAGEYIRQYRTQKRRCDEENAVLRGIVKRAKSDGINTKAMIAGVQATKIDPDQASNDLRDQMRYMSIMRIPLDRDELFGWWEAMPAAANQDDDDQWYAQDGGYRAGRGGVAVDDCPYDTDSDLAEQWTEYWHKGQLALAREMGEMATPVAARRDRPDPAPEPPRLAGPKRRSRSAA